MCVKSCCHSNSTETQKFRETWYKINLQFESHDFISAAPLECEPTPHSLLMAGMCFSARQGKKKGGRKGRIIFKIIIVINHYSTTAVLPILIRN
jgi:hypothetical protein